MPPNTKYTNITASTQIRAGAGTFDGIIVNSHTAGTIKMWDSLTASGNVIMNTYTFPAGSSFLILNKGCSFYTGLFATVGGTVDLTILSTPN